jgi:hypothetical protein
MNGMIGVLRDGTWLSAARIQRLGSAAALGTLAFLLFLALTAHGANDYTGRPLGTDFSSFYAAGRLIQLGANPYDPASLHKMQQAMFGNATPYYSFAYPPFFLLPAWILAKLPYLVALALWQLSTFALYLWSMVLLKRRFAPALQDRTLYLCAAGFTAVFVNVTHGQNGFLTAALFAAAIASLGMRPWLAGLCFGLAAYKPQLGLLVPFALAAGGHWRSFTAAVLTLVVLAAICTLLFGGHVWPEFFAGAGQSRQVILEAGRVGYDKMVSVFAWARLWRLPLGAAYAGQAIVALLVIAMTVRLWRAGDPRLQGAGLCLGTLLVTPFALDYDLMIIAPAILLLASYEIERRQFPFGATLLFLLWLIPLFARGLAGAMVLPLANWSVVGAFLLTMKLHTKWARV